MIERQRDIRGKVSIERAFSHIGSKGIGNAKAFSEAARSHWAIENGANPGRHFREDDCRVRKGHGPQNFSALRKFILTLLRQDTQYPNAASVADAKPLTETPTTALHCSACRRWGKCNCPDSTACITGSTQKSPLEQDTTPETQSQSTNLSPQEFRGQISTQ